METLVTRKTDDTSAETENITTIHWKQLWSLAALYGSVIIGWIAYQNYQPRLLVQFRFTDFSFLLMVMQGIILVVTPLIAGKLGDRYRLEKGHRLPVISSGISFAAMIFMAVAFTLLGNPGEIFRWILPVLIVFWLIAMSIFTSPALSTIELFTPIDKLPRAMAMLTIVGNVVYSLEPVIVDIIDYLGAPLTFICGGVVVFLSGYALKKNSLGLFKQSGDREARSSLALDTKLRSQYGFIFFLGLTLGVATTIMFNFFPSILEDKLGAILRVDGKIIIVGMLVFSAMLSWPASYAVNAYGMVRMFWMSFVFLLMSTLMIWVGSLPPGVLLMVIIFAIAFTTLSVSALPLAIRRSSYREKVFCVGVFFSGVALPEGFWEALLTYG